MALLTEEDVRRMSNQGTRGPVVVNRDQMLTPGARDYLREHRVEVVYPQGEAAGEISGGRRGRGPRPPPPNTALCSVPH